jgi:iron complex outermembrane recepter protein
MSMATRFKLSVLSLAVLTVTQTHAQQTAEPITVTGARAPVLEAAQAELGLPVKLKDAPQSVIVLTNDLLREAGVKTLTQAAKLDASLGDFYNTTGYVESLQIRGLLLDSLYNYKRYGLPISSAAPLALENKERLEILKGASGLQSGTSAPGGLVNSVLKRPTNAPLRQLELGVSERGTLYLAADLGGRSESGVIGYRINAATEKLRPVVRDAQGTRDFASAFVDYRLSNATLIEAEFEAQRRSQPSVPG